jgi:hypothetical protein
LGIERQAGDDVHGGGFSPSGVLQGVILPDRVRREVLTGRNMIKSYFCTPRFANAQFCFWINILQIFTLYLSCTLKIGMKTS